MPQIPTYQPGQVGVNQLPSARANFSTNTGLANFGQQLQRAGLDWMAEDDAAKARETSYEKST